MSFFKDFFANILGNKNNNRDNSNQGNDHEHFRNPIWQNEQGEDDDDYTDDYRSNHFSYSGPINFEVYTDPVEITRVIESMMQSFLSSFDLDIPKIETTISTDQYPQSFDVKKKSLRDEVMKPEFSRKCDLNRPKIDKDLDGKINSGELSEVLKHSQDLEPKKRFPHVFTSTGQTIVYKRIKHGDGTVEETKTVTDNAGNTEQMIKKKTGDNKIHTVITKKDKNGLKTETETFENMDENEILQSTEHWKSKNQKVESIEPAEPILSSFPWHKFFGTDPKL